MMDFNKLLAAIDTVAPKKTYDNDSVGFWKMTKDKAGNASAIIRFLPNKAVDDIPFVRKYAHAFKDDTTGRWYIENSLSTIGNQDYIAEQNFALWNTGLDENKEIVRKRKRKMSYISNIYVIKDAENPQNEGKTFKFQYGKKIFEKIVEAAKPDASLGEEPINAFDPVSGADFLLKQTVVAGYPNFDQSRFSSQKPLFAGDQAKIDKVLEQCFDINEEIAPSKFKTYEELKSKFLWVTGQDKPTARAKPSVADYDAELDSLAKAAETKQVAKKSPPIATMSKEDSDDDSAFFANLLEN